MDDDIQIENHSKLIAESAAQKCEIPIVILIPVISSILNVCINCWGQVIRQNCRTVDEGINDLRSSYAQRPQDVQRRLAARVFFYADPPVTATTAKAIAESMIEHACHESNREPIKYLLGKAT